MKKLLILLVAVLMGASFANAQGSLLNDLKRQATNAVRMEANKAVNNAKRDARNSVRGAVNNARNGAYSNNNNTTSQQLVEHNHSHADAAAWTCPECGHAGNEGNFCSNCGAKRPAAQAKSSSGKSVWTCPTCGKADNEGSFCANCGTNRPDGNNVRQEERDATAESAEEQPFVRGKNLLFEDPMVGETTYERPSKWELLGTFPEDCYVVEQAGDRAILLKGFHSDIKPKMKKEHYLPASFTVEMDIWFENKVENALTHSLELNFASEDAIEEFSAIFRFGADEEESGSVAFRYYGLFATGGKMIEDKDQVRGLLKPGAWNHAAVSYDHGTAVLYVNGKSILKVTEQKQPTYIRVDAICSSRDHFVFKNFRIDGN